MSRAGSSICGEQSTSKTREPKYELFSFGAYENLSTRLSHVEHTPSNIIQQRAQNLMPVNPTTELKRLKRKAQDSSLDLDLSLKLNTKMDGEGTKLEDNEVDSNLSLSLCSQSSSSNLSSRLKEAKDRCEENGKRASTLDLTIWMRQILSEILRYLSETMFFITKFLHFIWLSYVCFLSLSVCTVKYMN